MYLWDHQEAQGVSEGILHNSGEAMVLVELGTVEGALSEAKERQMGTTSLIPNVRPTTKRTGVPSPSFSSCFSKVVTILVTMVTIMTIRNFIRMLMGNSGNRQVRA